MKHERHVPPRRRRTLAADQAAVPSDLARSLAEMAPVERDALEQIWRLSSARPPTEPSGPRLQEMQANVWSRLEKELWTEAPERPDSRAGVPARRLLAADRGAVRAQRSREHLAPHASRLIPLAFGLMLVLFCVGYILRPVTVTAPVGETLQITLVDGSGVQLNSGSTLSYSRLFNISDRQVSLTGEAYFDVTHGHTPFVVRTDEAEVRVLGTRFNVRAWDAPNAPTVVTLEEGRVRLSPAGAPDRAVDLVPGQQSTIGSAKGMPSSPVAVNPEHETAWRTGRFVYSARPLADILADVSHQYGVEVVAEDAALAAETLTLSLERPERVEDVLDVLCNAYDMYDYRWQGAKVILVRRGLH